MRISSLYFHGCFSSLSYVTWPFLRSTDRAAIPASSLYWLPAILSESSAHTKCDRNSVYISLCCQSESLLKEQTSQRFALPTQSTGSKRSDLVIHALSGWYAPARSTWADGKMCASCSEKAPTEFESRASVLASQGASSAQRGLLFCI